MNNSMLKFLLLVVFIVITAFFYNKLELFNTETQTAQDSTTQAPTLDTTKNLKISKQWFDGVYDWITANNFYRNEGDANNSTRQRILYQDGNTASLGVCRKYENEEEETCGDSHDKNVDICDETYPCLSINTSDIPITNGRLDTSNISDFTITHPYYPAPDNYTLEFEAGGNRPSTLYTKNDDNEYIHRISSTITNELEDENCASKCDSDNECVGFTWKEDGSRCYLLRDWGSDEGSGTSHDDLWSYKKSSPTTQSATTTQSPTTQSPTTTDTPSLFNTLDRPETWEIATTDKVYSGSIKPSNYSIDNCKELCIGTNNCGGFALIPETAEGLNNDINKCIILTEVYQN